jgi:hypothetical protein
MEVARNARRVMLAVVVLKRIPGTPHGLAGSGWIAIDKSNARKYPF